jgi:hypothetical protein
LNTEIKEFQKPQHVKDAPLYATKCLIAPRSWNHILSPEESFATIEVKRAAVTSLAENSYPGPHVHIRDTINNALWYGE